MGDKKPPMFNLLYIMRDGGSSIVDADVGFVVARKLFTERCKNPVKPVLWAKLVDQYGKVLIEARKCGHSGAEFTYNYSDFITLSEVEDIVNTIENEMMNQTDCEYFNLIVKSNGNVMIIDFIGIQIWDSENDERPYIEDDLTGEDTDERVSLDEWLRKEIQTELHKLNQIFLIELKPVDSSQTLNEGIPDEVAVLCDAIREDNGFYFSWQSNIAMAIYDQFDRDSFPTDKSEIKQVCNKGASAFLRLLIQESNKENENNDPNQIKKG